MFTKNLVIGKVLHKLIRVPLLLVLFLFVSGLAFAGGGTEIRDDSANTSRTVPEVIMSPEDLQNSFRAVAEAVLPVVVEINVIEVIKQDIPRSLSPWDFFFGPREGEEREFRRPGLGSGVLVRREGSSVYVLTNNHVVGEADEISVRLTDGREYEASIVGKDPRIDLALIKFETRDDIPLASLGDSDSLRVGDWVLAVGNPFGFESSVTAGIVSALGRRAEAGSPIAGFTDYIQTDASINPGNSGGALVNLKGEIVGINTWIASQSGGSVGLGFAIPINNAKRAINDFIEKGKISYGWLGVSIQDTDPETFPQLREALELGEKNGSLIVNVHDGSPADEGGILPGDFITSVNGSEIRDSNHLSRIIGTKSPGTDVEFKLVRYGSEKSLRIRLEERGTEEEVQSNRNLWPGMMPIPLSDQIRENLDIPSSLSGVLTVSVINGTPAATAGIRNGDIITHINAEPVDRVMEFYRKMNSIKKGEVNFRINREGTEILLGIIKG